MFVQDDHLTEGEGQQVGVGGQGHPGLDIDVLGEGGHGLEIDAVGAFGFFAEAVTGQLVGKEDGQAGDVGQGGAEAAAEGFVGEGFAVDADAGESLQAQARIRVGVHERGLARVEAVKVLAGDGGLQKMAQELVEAGRCADLWNVTQQLRLLGGGGLHLLGGGMGRADGRAGLGLASR